MYATINEMATGAIVTVCRGGKRRRHVYTSTTSSIEIHFDEQIGNEMDVTYFVLEYGGIIKSCILDSYFVICCIYNTTKPAIIHIHTCTYIYHICVFVIKYILQPWKTSRVVFYHMFTSEISLAFGCTDPSVPVHAQIHREGDHATISCPHPSDVSWEITCHNGQWKGPAVNCSTRT